MSNLRDVGHAYLTAKEAVIAAGYAGEIVWQDSRRFEDLTEREFLKEAAWVILSAGMREQVIRRKFSDITEAFLDWISASEIVGGYDRCKSRAMASFKHEGKIDAILYIASEIDHMGFTSFLRRLETEGVAVLETFPYLGPATSLHLAKNLGMQVAKPDRHLLRIAEKTGYDCPNQLCRAISEIAAESISVVDLVLWRYANLHRDYLRIF